MRHEVSIEFESREAIISSIPENTYTPELLAQDMQNNFYYIDSKPERGMPNYSIRMLDRDDNGNIYFVLSPGEADQESSDRLVSALKNHDPSFRNFCDAHFKNFSIFLGEEGDSLEQAKITRAPEHDKIKGELRLNFRLDDIKGVLLIPYMQNEPPVVDISERWKKEKRRLFEIPIRASGNDFKAL